MKLHQAKDILPIIQGIAAGKVLQAHNGDGVWKDWFISDDIDFSAPPSQYRIKPEAKLRGWTAGEVPVDAIFRLKGDPSTWFRVAGAIKGHLKISLLEDYGSGFTTSDYWPLEEKCEHSVDGGKTWLPCGVLE